MVGSAAFPNWLAINETIDKGVSAIQLGHDAAALESFTKGYNLALEKQDEYTIRQCSLNIGAVHVMRGEAECGLTYLRKAIPPSGHNGGKSNGDLFLNIALAYEVLGDLTEACRYLELSLEEYTGECHLNNSDDTGGHCSPSGHDSGPVGCTGRSEDHPPRGDESMSVQCSVVSRLAMLYSRRRQWLLAAHALQSGVRVAGQARAAGLEARLLARQAACLLRAGRALHAIQVADTAMLRLLDVAAETTYLGNLYNELCLVYCEAKDFVKAATCLEIALPAVRGQLTLARAGASERAAGRQQLAVVLQNLGAVYNSLHDYSSALRFHKAAAAAHSELGQRASEGQCQANMAFAYSQLGDMARAKHSYTRTLNAARHTGDGESEWQALEGLGAVHFRLGSASQATRHYFLALDVLSQGEAWSEARTRIASKLAQVEQAKYSSTMDMRVRAGISRHASTQPAVMMDEKCSSPPAIVVTRPSTRRRTRSYELLTSRRRKHTSDGSVESAPEMRSSRQGNAGSVIREISTENSKNKQTQVLRSQSYDSEEAAVEGVQSSCVDVAAERPGHSPHTAQPSTDSGADQEILKLRRRLSERLDTQRLKEVMITLKHLVCEKGEDGAHAKRVGEYLLTLADVQAAAPAGRNKKNEVCESPNNKAANTYMGKSDQLSGVENARGKVARHSVVIKKGRPPKNMTEKAGSITNSDSDSSDEADDCTVVEDSGCDAPSTSYKKSLSVGAPTLLVETYQLPAENPTVSGERPGARHDDNYHASTSGGSKGLSGESAEYTLDRAFQDGHFQTQKWSFQVDKAMDSEPVYQTIDQSLLLTRSPRDVSAYSQTSVASDHPPPLPPRTDYKHEPDVQRSDCEFLNRYLKEQRESTVSRDVVPSNPLMDTTPLPIHKNDPPRQSKLSHVCHVM